MSIEDRILLLNQQKKGNPFGWLICFENRPLQAIPPKGKGPHLLFFSTEERAGAFIADRKKYYGEEPLSMVGIDSADSLKTLALDFCNDPRYAAPPCGIVFDFDYSTKKVRKVLPPAEVNRKLPAEIGSIFGYKPVQAVPASVTPPQPKLEPAVLPVPAPAPAARPLPPPAIESKPKNKKPLTAVLITCGSLLVVGLALLCLGGAAWYGMKRGAIPALPFLYTPTATSTPTPRPTSTPIPTATPTPVVWNVNISDDFSANTHGWSLGDDTWSTSSSHMSIENGKLHWEMADSASSYMNWQVPDLPAVSDFDAAVDIQRTAGSTTGDYGIVLRYDPNTYSFYYFGIKDASQMYKFIVYEGDNLTTITDWTYASAIRPGQVNRLEVIGKGSSFTLSINGVQVGQVENGGLASGQMGIFTYLSDPGDRITLEYDNLVYLGNK